MFGNVHECIYMYVCAYVYTCIYTYTYAHTYTYKVGHLKYLRCIYTHMYIHFQLTQLKCRIAQRSIKSVFWEHAPRALWHIHLFSYIYTFIYIYIYKYIYIYSRSTQMWETCKSRSMASSWIWVTFNRDARNVSSITAISTHANSRKNSSKSTCGPPKKNPHTYTNAHTNTYAYAHACDRSCTHTHIYM